MQILSCPPIIVGFMKAFEAGPYVGPLTDFTLSVVGKRQRRVYRQYPQVGRVPPAQQCWALVNKAARPVGGQRLLAMDQRVGLWEASSISQRAQPDDCPTLSKRSDFERLNGTPYQLATARRWKWSVSSIPLSGHGNALRDPLNRDGLVASVNRLGRATSPTLQAPP